jgi:sugar lactone lactonase YvrE
MSNRLSSRVGVALAACGLLIATASAASPAAAASSVTGHRHTIVFRLVPTHGNPEGVAWDPATQAFFVGSVADGTIYRGTLGSRVVRPFIPGAQGRVAVGMKVFGGKLYVAGGPTGTITVYDLATRHRVAGFETGTGGFLNDLVVVDNGDVFVTDSFRPVLWRVTAAEVAAGHGQVHSIAVGPEIPYTAGAFNLNGIVAYNGGKQLVVVNTSNGKLYKIVRGSTSSARVITRITGATVLAGDGMVVDRGHLVVVSAVNPDRPLVTFLNLNARHTHATIDRVRTGPSLLGSSTIAVADGRYLVVNANFASTTGPFTVTGLVRG